MLLQINESNNIFLAKGMNFTKLCTEQGEVNLYPVSHSTWFENTASRLLFNNKMLVIYNVRTVNVPEPRLDKELKKFKSENRKFIDFWNLNYISEADTLLKAFDTKKQLFILFEVFDNKLEINQWNYANKQWLGKQAFPSLSINPLSEPQSALYFSDNYLLIRAKNEQLTLFKRENQQFIELWTKTIPNLIAVSKIYFSQDERFIVLDDFTLLDMQTGKLTSHYPANLATDIKKYTVLIEPALKEVAERFNMPFLQGNHFISNYDADLRCANSATFKTQLYSLTANKIIKEIDGLVLDISPDGKTLAACKGSELFLMPTKP